MNGLVDGGYPACVRLPIVERGGEQGERGTCVAFSLVGLLEYYRGKDRPPLSTQYVYACCKAESNGTPGVDLLSAVASVRRCGVCTLEAWGYNPSNGASQGQIDISRLKEFPVEDCSGVPFHVLYSAGNISEYKAALSGSQGFRPMPVVVGVRVFGSVVSSRNGWFPMCCDGDAVAGYHAMLVYGYKDTPGCPSAGYFMALNSWGSEWSPCGTAKIPYEFVQKHGMAAVTIRAVVGAVCDIHAAASETGRVCERSEGATVQQHAFSAAPQRIDETCGEAVVGTSVPKARKTEGISDGMPLKIVLSDGCVMTFVKIHSGCFTMGSPASEPGRFGNEDSREVTLSRDFWLCETPVTQRQYSAVMGENPSLQSGDECPVDMVSWEDASAFCVELTCRAGAQLPIGYECALPTEAEWEYACRGSGQTGMLEDGSWYEGNSGGVLHPVRQKAANSWGLYDMLGNVWEWCRDGYESQHTGFLDPIGIGDGMRRVIRGGSAGSPARYCRASSRLYANRMACGCMTGFRVALVSRAAML